MLGLDLDPAPFERALARVPSLRAIARGLRGMRPPRFPDFFEAFASVIPFQQVSLDAGMAVVTRLIERFGEPIEREGVRVFAFPSADIIAGARIDALRRCGLSARKAESLRTIARTIDSGELSEAYVNRLPTSEALRVLATQPGIGPWSASLVLLRGLGRLDAFPPGDVGVARGLGALISDDTIERVIERFGEFRGYLYFCALGASLLDKGVISPALRA
jgi:DNA-3-methyladenine glycosylase II